MLTAIDLPTIAQVLDGSADYPFLSILLKLDIATIKEVAGEIDLHGAVAGAVDSGMAVGTATSELLDAFLRLMALADTPPRHSDPGQAPDARGRLSPAAGARRPRTSARSLCRGRGAAGWRGVIAHLRDNYAQPVRIEELAEMAAMGISTLHHHFNGLTRMSPLQYQKHIRLHEARRLLLTEHLDAGSAAFRVGYESVTQFSREYRRLFGAPPMRDVAQLRQARRDATIAAQ
jgi:AraC-like DNA-binding protein